MPEIWSRNLRTSVSCRVSICHRRSPPDNRWLCTSLRILEHPEVLGHTLTRDRECLASAVWSAADRPCKSQAIIAKRAGSPRAAKMGASLGQSRCFVARSSPVATGPAGVASDVRDIFQRASPGRVQPPSFALKARLEKARWNHGRKPDSGFDHRQQHPCLGIGQLKRNQRHVFL